MNSSKWGKFCYHILFKVAVATHNFLPFIIDYVHRKAINHCAVFSPLQHIFYVWLAFLLARSSLRDAIWTQPKSAFIRHKLACGPRLVVLQIFCGGSSISLLPYDCRTCRNQLHDWFSVYRESFGRDVLKLHWTNKRRISFIPLFHISLLSSFRMLWLSEWQTEINQMLFSLRKSQPFFPCFDYWIPP